MRPFDFPIELRAPWFDIHVPYPFILDMPMELRLESMIAVCSDGVNPGRAFLDDVIDERDGVPLVVPAVDPEG